ncbi:hypothetical protein HYR99_35640 [Candidatus Poribacteria bacterium]|nr:hypothetical protein [Candidatus Poribacteria bacterium]
MAFGTITLNATIKAMIKRDLTIKSIHTTGGFTDLYDFNYEGGGLSTSGATVQLGFNARADNVAGGIFETEVIIDSQRNNWRDILKRNDSYSGTLEGWSFEGYADGIPASLAGPFISPYDGNIVSIVVGPDEEAVWGKSTQGSGCLRKELQIPPLPPDGSKIYLTFWYDWVAVAQDGVPPGGMEIFLDGKSRLKLEPTDGRQHSDQMVQ